MGDEEDEILNDLYDQYTKLHRRRCMGGRRDGRIEKRENELKETISENYDIGEKGAEGFLQELYLRELNDGEDVEEVLSGGTAATELLNPNPKNREQVEEDEFNSVLKTWEEQDL